MKKFILALTALFYITVSVQAMSYEQARQQALFLTDKMAYELNLTNEQYEAAYEINLDYLMGVNTVDDLYGVYWERRNLDLSYILLSWQYRAFCDAAYFYRPLYWNAGYWHFGIYARYPHRDYFYFGRPTFYVEYRGGHAWHMNGGRSWYHGRNFCPDHHHNNRYHGMRDGFQRGDFGNGFRGNPNSATQFGTARRPPIMGNPNNNNSAVGARPNTSFGSRGNGNSTSFGSRRNGNGLNNGNGFGRRESSTRNTVTRPNVSAPSTSFGGGRNGSVSNGGTFNSTPRNTFSPNRSNSSSSFGGGRVGSSSSFGGGRSNSSSSRPSYSAPDRSSSSSSSSFGRGSSSFGGGRGGASFGGGRGGSSSNNSNHGGGSFGGGRR